MNRAIIHEGHKRVVVTSKAEGSNWSLRFERRGTNLLIHLHWGDKSEPTHTFAFHRATILEAIKQA